MAVAFTDAVKTLVDGQYEDRMKVLIEKLDMVAHPEGGFFREMYRSGAPTMESMGRTDPRGELMPTCLGDRNQLTSMYWMANQDAPILKMGVNVSMHIHYFNGGAPFRYYLIAPSGEVSEVILGPDPARGHVQQMIVPSDTYKFGRLERPEADFMASSKRFVLVSEAVVPGFDFGDFHWVTEEMLRGRLGAASSSFDKFAAFLYEAPGDRGFDRFYSKE